MTKYILVGLVAVAASSASALTISFDEAGPATGLFNNANPLTTDYSGIGVTFSGPNPMDGGAILNQSGAFGVNALSGTNFLAFNRAGTAGVQMLNGGHPYDPEQINFSVAVNTVSINASGGNFKGVFVMTAFDSSNNLLGGSAIATAVGQWGLLSFNSSTNISKVVLTEATNAGYFVYDDLSTSAVPEPASMAVLGLGAAALIRKRRKK